MSFCRLSWCFLAGEFERLFAQFNIGEADDVGRGESGMGEGLEGAEGDELGGFFVEGFGGGIDGGLGFVGEAQPPVENVRAVDPPDGGSGGGDAPRGAHLGAGFPTIAHVGRRIVEEDHELVEIRRGVVVRHRRMLQAMKERAEAWDGDGGKVVSS